MSNGTGFIAASDLYNQDAVVARPDAAAQPSMPTRVSEQPPIKAAPAVSWLLLVALFIVFGIVYKMSELSE